MTIDKALSHPLITVLECDYLSGYFCFRLGSLKTEIDIWLNWRADIKKWSFTQSHAINTPEQDAPYWTSRPWNDTPSSALEQVICGFAEHYISAVTTGLTPNETWLEPNPNSEPRTSL